MIEGISNEEIENAVKISVDRGKEQNANRPAAPYSAASGTMKSFHKINDDPNDCNNDGVEKTSAMWKKKAEQDVSVDATLNAMEDTFWELARMLLEIRLHSRAKEIETAEIEVDNQINKPEYDTTGSETNYQTIVPPAEDEVFAEEENGRKKVTLMEERMLTDGTNGGKQILPVRIESHTENPDKEIIAIQKEGKSIALLLTEYQQKVQALQRMSKTMLTQTILPAACTEDLDLFQQDVKKKKMGYFPLANSVEKFENDSSSHPSFLFSSADLNDRGTFLSLLSLFYSSEAPTKENINLREVWKTISGPVFEKLFNWLHGTILTTSDTLQYYVNEQIDYQHEIKQIKQSVFLATFLSELSSHNQMFQNFQSGIVKSKSEAAKKMKIDLFNTEEKQHLFFLFIVDSFVSSEKDNINLGEVLKAGRSLVLQNLFIWQHGKMVKTSDTSQTPWLTKWYGETKLSVYSYKFSFLLLVQFRLTSSHWQDVVKKNVMLVNFLIITKEILSPRKDCNRNIHPKITTMSLIFLYNDDPGPCQRIPSQFRLQTGIVKTLLQFDANKKSEENAAVLQAMEKKVDNGVLMKYRGYYRHKNYGRQNGIDPNCKKFKKNSIIENIREKTPQQFDVNKKKGEKQLDANRTGTVLLEYEDFYTHKNYGRHVSLTENTSKKISDTTVKILLKLHVNKKNWENALTNAPVLQAIRNKLDANHTASNWLEYGEGADTELKKYDRQSGIQPDRKTFDVCPLHKNTPDKTPERKKLCTVSETNDETRCMSQPMENESSYFIYLNSIAINKQVPWAELLNIYQKEADVGVGVITGIETGGPFLKNMAVPFKDETYARRRGVVREIREVTPTTRLDPHQGVIRDWEVDKKAFNDNPTMNT